MSLTKQVGEALARYRIKNRMTQAQLGERLGTDMSTISRWERGLQAIPLAAVEQMLAVLGVPPQELLGTFEQYLQRQGLQVMTVQELAALPLAGEAHAGRPLYWSQESPLRLGEVLPLARAAAVYLADHDLPPLAQCGDVLLIEPYWVAQSGDAMLLSVGERLAVGRLRPDRAFERLNGGGVWGEEGILPLGRVLMVLRQIGKRTQSPSEARTQ